MAESVIKRGDRFSIFHQLDSIGFAVQNDGRFQISGQSGNTRRVITFGENGVLSEVKTTDGGSTFSTLWENKQHIIYDFSVNIPPADSASGQKTYNITIPSGYRLASSRIYGSYVSGEVNTRVTDKKAVFVQDGTVQLQIFLYNPNKISANLAFAGAVYLEKVT